MTITSGIQKRVSTTENDRDREGVGRRVEGGNATETNVNSPQTRGYEREGERGRGGGSNHELWERGNHLQKYEVGEVHVLHIHADVSPTRFCV